MRSTSSPRKPKTGQAPIIRNMIPHAKLSAQMHSSRMRKPVEPSERCGVRMAAKIFGSEWGTGFAPLSPFMAAIIRKTMAKQTTGRKAPQPRRKPPGKTASAPRKGNRLKSATLRAAADREAAHGELPQWTEAEVEEAFRRFAAANPAPRGELQSINPFTLLIAVVLSAQATDAGVNKATPALFELADTPEKMVKVGEARVRSLIKTIGLYRTKAKNVIALSRI